MVYKYCKLPNQKNKDKNLLAEKSFNYSLIFGFMFYIFPNQVIFQCIREDETYDILRACHDEPYGGHFAAKQTTFKILTIRYYWPSSQKDATRYKNKCDKSQCMWRLTKLDEIPLQPQVAIAPFDKWGIDFVAPIEPSSQVKSYILDCTDYVTKWAKAKPMKYPRDNNISKLFYESIFTWFGVPRELTSNQRAQLHQI